MCRGSQHGFGRVSGISFHNLCGFRPSSDTRVFQKVRGTLSTLWRPTRAFTTLHPRRMGQVDHAPHVLAIEDRDEALFRHTSGRWMYVVRSILC